MIEHMRVGAEDTAGPVVTVVGVGNPYRRDDGVGWEVVNRMKDQAPPGVGLIKMSGEVATLLDIIQSSPHVFVFDAVVSGADVGTVLRFESHKSVIPAKLFNCSTHGLGLAEAIELARALHKMPQQLFIYGIECTDFDVGTGLSVEVQQAIPGVVASALQDIETVLREEQSHPRWRSKDRSK